MIEKCLKEICEKYEMQINDTELQKFALFYNLVVDWNKKINLTSIIDVKDFAIKHFLDCLLLLKSYDMAKGANLIDVGTGAGFPGLVLKIVRDDIKLTLLDSLDKRISFLKCVCKELNIDANCIHARAEDLSKLPNFREKFDIVTSRAVAKLNILSELCIPFVKLGGIFLAMKSQNYKTEIEQSCKTISILGGEIINTKLYNLPDSHFRAILLIKKISATNSKYPRKYSQILKKSI